MAASSEAVPRRKRRFVRADQPGPFAPTPPRVAALRQVGEWGLASTPQVAAVSCASEKAARRALRALFDAGYVEPIPIPRCALAPTGVGNGAELLFGSAPGVYRATKSGLRLLRQLGVELTERELPRFGPRNALFVAHELAVRDFRVWLELAARAAGFPVVRWADGGAAEIALGRTAPPKVARPDAWFALRVGERTLVGLAEADRGTEPLGKWKEKLASYAALYRGGRLREATGYANARVLVTAPGARRRDWIARTVAEHAAPGLADRFWVADAASLAERSLHAPAWRQPGAEGLVPLLPPPAEATDILRDGAAVASLETS